ncbi:NUDIX domain-containing protein [Alkalicoccus chagannorensis]|uniref:NUDIX domain-containing protein n=1 Tax=Alkalicoccus chagannorensis TaxID=427072 RepID=UPI00047C8A30|nr:NUDIX domain-containing protein [Alkalicoccus chagannorensis]
MRQRAGLIIIQEAHVLLLQKRQGNHFSYTFPTTETDTAADLEASAIREASSLTGSPVRLETKAFVHAADMLEHYYYVSLVPGTHETLQSTAYANPVWMPVAKLAALDIRPKSAAVKVADTAPAG